MAQIGFASPRPAHIRRLGHVLYAAGLRMQRAMAEHVKVEPNMRLYLRADRTVKFQLVKRAMTACAAAGVSDVIFATYEHDIYTKDEKK